jgi:hypothetical protein
VSLVPPTEPKNTAGQTLLFDPGEPPMDTRPLRILLTANAAVFLMVCAVFFVHHLGVGLYPDDMESWLEDNQWLMWIAAALTVPSAAAIPLLSVRNRQADSAVEQRRGRT